MSAFRDRTFSAREQRVVRAFIKKTEKTPTSEIHLGLQRAKEVKP
jgi:phage-related protein